MDKKQYENKIENLIRSMYGLQYAIIAQLHEQTEPFHYPISYSDKEKLLKAILPFKEEVPMLTLIMNSLGHIHVFRGVVNDYLCCSNKQNITRKTSSGEIVESNSYIQDEAEKQIFSECLSEDEWSDLNNGYVLVVKDWGYAAWSV